MHDERMNAGVFFEETSGKLTAHDTIYDAHVQRTQSQQTI
jgi:hypothetical protein